MYIVVCPDWPQECVRSPDHDVVLRWEGSWKVLGHLCVGVSLQKYVKAFRSRSIIIAVPSLISTVVNVIQL